MRKRSYQDKRVRRGAPSDRYRMMHDFPTSAKEFGQGQFVSPSGMEFRVADGTDKEQLVRAGKITNASWGMASTPPESSGGTQLMYYYVPRKKRLGMGPGGRDVPKPLPKRGDRISMVYASTGQQYTGEVMETRGSFYKTTNSGAVVLKNVRLTGERASGGDVDAILSNARGAMTRRLMSTLGS